MKPRYSLPGMAFAALVIAFALRSHGAVHAQGSPDRKHDERVTFDRDIAPIVFRSCARCHRPGEAGPFPLLTYEDARKHARQMEIVTRTRFMPPWLPEPQAQKFADEPRLSERRREIRRTYRRNRSLRKAGNSGSPILCSRRRRPIHCRPAAQTCTGILFFPCPLTARAG